MTRLQRKVLAFLGALGIASLVVVPPQPALADFAVVSNTQTITTTGTPVAAKPLTGQSACSVEIVGSASGTTQVLVKNTWVNADSIQPSGTASPSPNIVGPGTWVTNCGGTQGYQFVPTSVSGSATITVIANGGINRVLGFGINGGAVTTVVGQSPITVTNAGDTATVGLAVPLPIIDGGTGATALPAGCLQSTGTQVISASCPTPGTVPTPVSVVAGNSNVTVATPSPGVFVISAVTPSPAPTGSPVSVSAGNGIGVVADGSGGFTVSNNGAISLLPGSNIVLATSSPGVYTINAITPSPAPTASPVSVTAGVGIGVATPSAGTFQVSNTGVLTVNGDSGNITVTGSANPVVSITAAPTFTQVTDSGLTPGDCVQAMAGGTLGTISQACIASITAGNSNVTVATPAPGVYVISSVTASPAPTGSPVSVTAGNGIAVAANGSGGFAVSNTGAISLLAGPNIALATSSPGVYTITAITPSPAPTASPVSVQAGNSNVTVATPAAGVFVISAVTPSPAPTSSPVSVTGGNGIGVVANGSGGFAVSNTGVISLAAGTANVTLATSSPGVYTISVASSSPAPTASPVSVQAGTGISVATPSAGTFVVGNSGVLSVAGDGVNISSSGGQNPVISETAAPTFTSVTAATVTDSGLTPGNCVQAIAGGTLATVASSCAGSVSVTAGNTNVTVATPGPGQFVISAITPSPAPTGNIIAGNGIGVSGTWPSITVANNGAISLVAGNNVTLATSSPGVYTINAVTPSPAPTASPVSVQAGANVTVATPSVGVFVVSATTAAPPSITSANANLTVATPAVNTYVLTSVTAAPPSITAGTANVTVATPAVNTYVISVATQSPAPAASPVSVQAGNTNVVVATPSPGVFVISTVTAAPYTAGTGINITSNVVSNTGVLSVSGSGNTSSTGGQNPVVTVTDAPTFAGQVSAASYKAGNLTSGDCLQSTLGVIVSASTSCPSGPVGTVTAGHDIVVTGGAPSPSVAVTDAPVFLGTTTTGQLIDSGLTASTCVGTSATKQLQSTGCVTSVTGSGNIASSGGSTPNITLTGIVPVGNGGTGTGALTANLCLGTTAGGVYGTSTIPCLGENTSASFVAPAVGSSVNVTISSAYVLGITQNHMPIIIDDGTTSFDGIVNTGAGTSTLNVTAVGYATGSAGATVAAGAVVTPGGNGRTTVNSVTGSGNISATAGATPNVTITDAPTFAGNVTAGNVTDSALTSGRCIQSGTSGLLTATAGACATGTLTGLTAGNDIVVGTGATPTVAVTNSPVFTGQTTSGSIVTNGVGGAGPFITSPGGTSATNQAFSAGSNLTNVPLAYMWTNTLGTSDWSSLGSNSATTINTIPGTCVVMNSNNSGLTPITSLLTGDCNGNFGITGAIRPGSVVSAGNVSAPSITDSGLTSGLCVQTTTGGQLTTTGTACSTATGTVTAVTGSGNIASTGGTTPNVTITNAPTFTGAVNAASFFASPDTGGGIGTAGGDAANNFGFFVSGTTNVNHPNALFVYNAGGTTNTIQGTDSTATINTVAGTCWSMYQSTASSTAVGTRLSTMDCSGNMGVAGNLHATTFTGSGAGLTTATVPNAALVTAPVTSVTGTGNISSTGGTTPVVSVTNAPTFTGTVTGNLLASTTFATAGTKCAVLAAGTGNISQNGGCGTFGGTNGTFVIPAVGSTVSVGVNEQVTLNKFAPISITDGTNTINGYSNTAVSAATVITFLVTGIVEGAVGNTMANSATIQSGQTALGGASYLNGAVQTGVKTPHFEQFNSTAITNGSTNTYTFGLPYVNIPVCQAAQNAATAGLGSGGVFIPTVTTTNVTVNNSSGATQTPFVSCIGL